MGFKDEIYAAHNRSVCNKTLQLSKTEIHLYKKKSEVYISDVVKKIKNELIEQAENRVPFEAKDFFTGKKLGIHFYRAYWIFPYRVHFRERVFKYDKIKYYDGDNTYASAVGLECNDYEIVSYFVNRVTEELKKENILANVKFRRKMFSKDYTVGSPANYMFESIEERKKSGNEFAPGKFNTYYYYILEQ